MKNILVTIEGVNMSIVLKTGRLDEEDILIPVFFPQDLTGNDEEDTDILLNFNNPVAAMRKIVECFKTLIPVGTKVLVEGKGKRQSVYERLLKKYQVTYRVREEDDLFYRSAIIDN